MWIRSISGASRGAGAAAGAFPTVLVLAMVACAGGTRAKASTGTGGAASGGRHQDTASAARVIFVGDTGTGDDRARRVATQIRRQAEAVPVSHVFLLGDNVYEHGSARSIPSKFLDVYRGVFSLGVRIHAALGNHDVEYCSDSGLRPVPRDESAYELSRRCEVDSHLATPEFGYLDGSRYYSIEIPGELPGWRRDGGGRQGHPRSEEPPLVEVFVLDSNTLGRTQTKLTHGSDEPQLRWLAEALQRSSARWKVVAIHHAVYTPTRCAWFRFGCRGEDGALQAELEPIFREHGVDVVFQAHQHLYARLRPQRGIRYFVTGAGGKKAESFREDARTVPREDRGSFNHYVYVRATEDQFGYCVIDAEGDLRDGGSFARGDATDGEVDLCSALSNAGRPSPAGTFRPASRGTPVFRPASRSGGPRNPRNADPRGDSRQPSSRGNRGRAPSAGPFLLPPRVSRAVPFSHDRIRMAAEEGAGVSWGWLNFPGPSRV